MVREPITRPATAPGLAIETIADGEHVPSRQEAESRVLCRFLLAVKTGSEHGISNCVFRFVADEEILSVSPWYVGHRDIITSSCLSSR